MKEYVLAWEDEPLCDRYVRQADESWALTSVVGLDGDLTFASVNARVRMADIYRGVEFPEPTGDESAGESG